MSVRLSSLIAALEAARLPSQQGLCATAVIRSAEMPAITSTALTVSARRTASFSLNLRGPVGSVRPAISMRLAFLSNPEATTASASLRPSVSRRLQPQRKCTLKCTCFGSSFTATADCETATTVGAGGGRRFGVRCGQFSDLQKISSVECLLEQPPTFRKRVGDQLLGQKRKRQPSRPAKQRRDFYSSSCSPA